MARDEDPWRRFRSRQLDKKGDLSAAKTRAIQGTAVESVVKEGSIDFDELMKKIEVMQGQLNNLYNQYIAGVEKRPPIEKRKQFDQLVDFLRNASKPTMNVRFKAQTVLTQCQSKTEHWEKMMRKLESGVMKRRLQSGG